MNPTNYETAERIHRLENELAQYVRAYQRTVRLNSGISTVYLGMLAKTSTALLAMKKSI
jgi:hypothetical protein